MGSPKISLSNKNKANDIKINKQLNSTLLKIQTAV
jgi:hypothetical protein